MKQGLTITIVGPQGSGKGTQAQLLKERLGFKVIGIGELLRKEIEKKSDIGAYVKKYLEQGQMAPDGFVFKVFSKALKNIAANQSLLFDGFPRQRSQFSLFEQLLADHKRHNVVVLVIHISEQESVARIANRYICKKNGTVYSGTKKQCEARGGTVTRRRDDTPKAVRKRLTIYHQETEPLIKAYRKKYKVITINGRQNVEDVYQDVINALNLT